MRALITRASICVTVVAAMVLSALVFGSGSAGAATKSFTVMIVGDFTSSVGYVVPETVPAAEEVLNRIPGLKVITCDSEFEPAAAVTCEDKAVEAGVVAVINGYGEVGLDSAILAQAGIPLIGDADTTEPNSFGLDSSFAGYVGMGAGAGRAGCKKAGILYYDGQANVIPPTQAGLKAEGSRVVASAAVPQTSPDMDPAVAKLTDAGARCIILSLTPAAVVQAVTAIRQSGGNQLIVGFGAIFPSATITALGKMADGVLLTNSGLGTSSSAAIVKRIEAGQKKINPALPFTSNSLAAWCDATLLADGLKHVKGNVTARSVTAALNGLRNVSFDGVINNISVVPLKSKLFRRYFNPYGINSIIKNGVPVADGGYYNITHALDLVKS
jgi:ABC-type branched-subunit amino acid transport system substrate-binding protein